MNDTQNKVQDAKTPVIAKPTDAPSAKVVTPAEGEIAKVTPVVKADAKE